MRQFLMHPTVRRGAQIVAGLIFLAAALPKIADLAAFAGSVHNFHLEPVLPIAGINLLAMSIPWIELIAGQAMARGLSFECGCFGKAGAATIGVKKLAENLAMLALGFVASVERR
jgi:uncharacterized membrane protein YphA (DoxX/SURF4 family)